MRKAIAKYMGKIKCVWENVDGTEIYIFFFKRQKIFFLKIQTYEAVCYLFRSYPVCSGQLVDTFFYTEQHRASTPPYLSLFLFCSQFHQELPLGYVLPQAHCFLSPSPL